MSYITSINNVLKQLQTRHDCPFLEGMHVRAGTNNLLLLESPQLGTRIVFRRQLDLALIDPYYSCTCSLQQHPKAVCTVLDILDRYTATLDNHRIYVEALPTYRECFLLLQTTI